jgi:rsbT co-antagonist protein RsbR
VPVYNVEMAASDQPESGSAVAKDAGPGMAAVQRELLISRSVLDGVTDGIIARTTNGQLLFYNQAFRELFGFTDETLQHAAPNELFARFRSQLKDPDALWEAAERVRNGHGAWQGSVEFIDGRAYDLSVRQLWHENEHLGHVWIIRDTSEQQRSQQALKVSEASLREVVKEQERLIATIREIGTPVLPIYNRVLVLPLVGHLDTIRSAHLMDELLLAIQRHQASVVIIDITGVSLVDTAVANSLIQSTQAAALLGAHCVLVGISAAVARTIVHLGVDLSQMTTRRDLQAGIAFALHHVGYAITVIREEPDWLTELGLDDAEQPHAEEPAPPPA